MLDYKQEIYRKYVTNGQALIGSETDQLSARWIIWKIFASFMRLMLTAETGPGKYILSQNITIIAKKQK